MLSAAKHLAVSVTYEDEILRLLPQDDIKTQSQTGKGWIEVPTAKSLVRAAHKPRFINYRAIAFSVIPADAGIWRFFDLAAKNESA